MGTLSDITARASNAQRVSNASSKGYRPISSPAEKENLGKSKSPHFMTPTFSSTRSTTPTSQPRATTPSSSKPNKASNGNRNPFFKRVGLRRVAEKPRSTKDTLAGSNKETSSTDNLTTPPNTSLSNPLSSAQDVKKTSPLDKPLPSPPAIEVDISSQIKSTATLIDATEIPLRHPPTGIGQKESWPVLRPQRAPSAGTLSEMMCQTGAELVNQASNANLERYPRLGSLAGSPAGKQKQPPVSTFSPLYKVPSNEVLDPYLRNTSKATGAGIADPFQDDKNVTDKADGHSDADGLPQLSSGAAALEKSASQDFTEVRQTRTSSLRARLSTGEIVSNRNSKVTGFTDFTAEPAGGNARRESLHVRKAGQAQPSSSNGVPPARSSSLTTPSINTKALKESIINRPPAKFVAGSRRPAPRRPDSRGSLHDDSLLPSRSAPPLPVYGNEPSSQGAMRAEGRHSSIPVPKSATNDADIQSGIGGGIDKAKGSDQRISRTASGKSGRKASIYNATGKIGLTTTDCRPEGTSAGETKQANGLEAIDESPRHTYKIKRLSTKTPEFGPTLAISPSADMFIMGLDHDKENVPLRKKQSKEFKTKKTLAQTPHKSGKTSAKKQSDRPSSSHGLPSPRLSQIDPNIREKKCRSVDISSGKKATNLEIAAAKSLSKNPSVATTTTASSASDPFYDASEEPQPETSSTPETSNNSAIQDSVEPTSEESLHSGDVARGNAVLETAASDKAYKTNQEAATSGSFAEYDPFKYDNVPPTNDVSNINIGQPTVSTNEPMVSVQLEPNTTPIRKRPDQSFLRPEKPDLNIDASRALSIHSTTKKTGPPTPPKGFGARQNNLGSSRGHASSQVDLLSASKRGSAAPESFKSRGSLPNSTSKGRFNFKGLFHKRSTENNDTVVNPRKKVKGKVAINGNGSPFPPINEIHPIHRPTLAFSTRSQGPSLQRSVPLSHNPSIAHRPDTPHTPILISPSPLPNELSRTTNLAMSLLESARREQSSPKKEKLLALGKVVVDVITQARDAEKAVEECKLALGRAEKAREACYRAIGEVGVMVEAVGQG